MLTHDSRQTDLYLAGVSWYRCETPLSRAERDKDSEGTSPNRRCYPTVMDTFSSATMWSARHAFIQGKVGTFTGGL
jgi:hypothetical protein